MFEGELYYSNGFWLVKGDTEYHLHPSNIQELDLIINTQFDFEKYQIEYDECGWKYNWEESYTTYVDRKGQYSQQKCLRMKSIQKVKVDYVDLRKKIITNQINGIIVEYDIEYENYPSQIHDQEIWYEKRKEIDPKININSDLNLVPDDFRKDKKNPSKDDLMHYLYVNYRFLSNYKTTRILNKYAKVHNLTYLI